MSPEEEKPETVEAPAAEEAPAPTPKKSDARPKSAKKSDDTTSAEPSSTDKDKKTDAKDEEEDEEEEEEKPSIRAPRRPSLDPQVARLLSVRDDEDTHRPRFVRQQFYRYARLERRGSWRRPRGLQSKQRRHYGYRPAVVRVGYRSPAAVRGRTPTGFIPVVVSNAHELAEVDAATEAAIFARTIGTRKRLILEETARQRGVKVLNPVIKDEREE